MLGIIHAMKNFWLTDNQLIELRAAHRAERYRNAAYKINAVILLGTGWKLRQVKEALLLDDETLRSYVEKYKSGGVKKLLETNHQGRSCHIDDSQQEVLCEKLESTIFLTTAAVIDYVEKEFGVHYSPTGMRDLLHRLGYEYKKPKLVPGNPDRESQEIFVEQYELFMEKKPADEEVLFADAVHPEHNTMAAYGWIKKGQKRKLETNSGRQRLNLHGAINIETLEMTVIESETINADSTVELLEILNQKYPLSSKLHIILDNARYHYSEEVKEFLSENERINLVFLPSYSPELNLIERVWKYFKKNILYNKYYATLQEFRETAQKFFRNIGQHKKALASLLAGGFEGFN
jgi:transposase